MFIRHYPTSTFVVRTLAVWTVHGLNSAMIAKLASSSPPVAIYVQTLDRLNRLVPHAWRLLSCCAFVRARGARAITWQWSVLYGEGFSTSATVIGASLTCSSCACALSWQQPQIMQYHALSWRHQCRRDAILSIAFWRRRELNYDRPPERPACNPNIPWSTQSDLENNDKRWFVSLLMTVLTSDWRRGQTAGSSDSFNEWNTKIAPSSENVTVII